MELSSFLSLGPDNDDGDFNQGNVGSAIREWVRLLMLAASRSQLTQSSCAQTETNPLTLGDDPGPTDDFSLFWMDPDEPGASSFLLLLPSTLPQFRSLHANSDWVGGTAEYPDGPLIAQLTVPTGKSWFVKLGLQGRMQGSEPDWQLPSVVWIHDEGGANCPPGATEEECMATIGTE